MQIYTCVVDSRIWQMIMSKHLLKSYLQEVWPHQRSSRISRWRRWGHSDLTSAGENNRGSPLDLCLLQHTQRTIEDATRSIANTTGNAVCCPAQPQSWAADGRMLSEVVWRSLQNAIISISIRSCWRRSGNQRLCLTALQANTHKSLSLIRAPFLKPLSASWVGRAETWAVSKTGWCVPSHSQPRWGKSSVHHG